MTQVFAPIGLLPEAYFGGGRLVRFRLDVPFLRPKKEPKKPPASSKSCVFLTLYGGAKKTRRPISPGRWPLPIELAQTVFCFSRLRGPKNRDLLKASPVGDDRDCGKGVVDSLRKVRPRF
jgi:hypothetical protein